MYRVLYCVFYAKEILYITSARERMTHGQIAYNRTSRFVEELPNTLVNDLSGRGKPDFRSRNSNSNDFLEFVDFSTNSKKGYGSKGYNGGSKSSSKTEPQIKLETYSQKKATATTIDYTVGDTVKHIKFGEGKVLEINPKGVDYEVSIEFPNYGTRKLLASFAKLKKI